MEEGSASWLGMRMWQVTELILSHPFFFDVVCVCSLILHVHYLCCPPVTNTVRIFDEFTYHHDYLHGSLQHRTWQSGISYISATQGDCDCGCD